MKKVVIDGKELEVRDTISSHMDFEEMTGKEMNEIKGTKERIQFIYCRLRAANRKVFLWSFEEFVELLDNDPTIMMQLSKKEDSENEVKEEKKSEESR